MCAQDHLKAIRNARLLDDPLAEMSRRQDEIRAKAAQLRDGGMAKEPDPSRILCS